MKFELPKLNYAYDSLEPYIDEKTMFIHHTKHHKAYTDNFNAAIFGVESLKDLSAEQIVANLNTLVPENIRQAVRNNGGGYVNHNLFFSILSPNPSDIEGELKEKIEQDFKSVEAFKEEFELAAKSQFGSGWAFLVLDKDKNLKIVKTANQDSPLTEGYIPLMGLDVWEHAYYLNYQNRRPEYIANFWKVLDWEVVLKNYKEAL